MPRYPSGTPYPFHLITITPWHPCSLGGFGGQLTSSQPASAIWPVANRAFYIPFRLPLAIIAKLMFTQNGNAVSGNFDIGIYNQAGKRVVSSGAVAHAGINQIQPVDITDTRIGPGLFYLALVFDNIVAQLYSNAPPTSRLRMAGCYIQNVYPLPAVATFASLATAYLPVFGLTTRDFV